MAHGDKVSDVQLMLLLAPIVSLELLAKPAATNLWARYQSP